MKYRVLETYEAGLALYGTEVKSLRAKLGKLDGSYVVVRGAEAYLVNATIPPYQKVNTDASFDENRNRKLLMSKKEIAELADSEDKKGLTIVPFVVYSKGRYIKARICIVAGKNARDKRQDLKARDAKREMARVLKKK